MSLRPQKFAALYNEVVSDWKRKGKHWWIGPLNQIVEGVCRHSPHHKNACDIYAKVALINRVYRTNLHRRVTEKVPFPELSVARQFTKGADVAMRPLRSLRSLRRNGLPDLVRCHTELMHLVHEVTKTWEVSFCSKYLSFHFPNVAPIYDLLAWRSARELVPQIDAWRCDPEVLNCDYGYHCLRVLQLLDILKGRVPGRPALRVVDFVLYSLLPEKGLV